MGKGLNGNYKLVLKILNTINHHPPNFWNRLVTVNNISKSDTRRRSVKVL